MPEDVIPDSIILQTSTIAGRVEGDRNLIRVPYVSDTEASYVKEDEDIPFSNTRRAEKVIRTAKMASFDVSSVEQLAQENAATMLGNAMCARVNSAAERAYLWQERDPRITTDANGIDTWPDDPDVWPPGILTDPGVVTGDPITKSLDPIADALGVLQANYSNPTHILVDPVGWSHLRKLKVAERSNQSLIGAGVEDSELRLFGLPVLVNPAMLPGKLAVIDKSVILSAVGPLVLSTSEHALFRSDSVALRVTWRFGARIIRPERCAVVPINL